MNKYKGFSQQFWQIICKYEDKWAYNWSELFKIDGSVFDSELDWDVPTGWYAW